mgnify:CR=1 FL=1
MVDGEIISAARYNDLQGKVSAVLGIGSGTKGYNQSVQSRPISLSEIVYTSHMNNLYTDMTNIYVHQTGALPSTISQVTSNDQITAELYNNFYSLITTAEADPQRFVVNSSQAVVESAGINSSRTATWGGTSTPQSVIHEFTASFTTDDARRAFFNAGGEIRIDLSLTHSLSSGDANYAKTNDWRNMLTAIGTVVFNHTSTSASSGTPSSIGNFDLTTSYQQVYRKIGSGVYVDNDVTIEAKIVSSKKISFKITLLDDANGGTDEIVNGSLSSLITQYRADGSYVDTPGPSWQNVVTLSGNGAVTTTGTDDTTCIAVCDESSSQRSAGMATKWANFRVRYPNRKFWLLQPGGSSYGELYEPAAWASDSNATGPIEVNRDDGIVANASNWFTTTGCNLLPSGSKVALSIDTSGSMTLSTVQASYNLFKSQCSSAGITVVEYSMSNEDWITPFDRIIS